MSATFGLIHCFCSSVSALSYCVSHNNVNAGGTVQVTSPSITGNYDWDSLNGYGTSFDVFSTDGMTLYYSGRQCTGYSNYACLMSLSPGNYRWRVTGALDPIQDSIAWEFCGYHGGASTELSFYLDGNGQCQEVGVNVC
jgi:hypothetical protein